MLNSIFNNAIKGGKGKYQSDDFGFQGHNVSCSGGELQKADSNLPTELQKVYQGRTIGSICDGIVLCKEAP
jgi:hypothetical protein